MAGKEVTITLKGEIADFDRLDNVYRAVKTQAPKLLDNWTLEINMSYRESGKTVVK